MATVIDDIGKHMEPTYIPCRFNPSGQTIYERKWSKQCLFTLEIYVTSNKYVNILMIKSQAN